MKRISAGPEEADIVDLSHEGHGVARIEGKAVFVADALPGERVVLRRKRRHRNFDEGDTEASPPEDLKEYLRRLHPEDFGRFTP